MATTDRAKLAVILHADVVSSTALVQKDERVAHERIRDAYLRFSETITTYDGTAREIRGDALVAEFERASDAVSAALTFQTQNAEHNERLSGDIRPEIRVGISLGEVVVADEILTGAAVILAQRLEQLAEPGGVCIQHAVYEALPRRLAFEYESLPEQLLKGFDEPVRPYRVTRRGQFPEGTGLSEIRPSTVQEVRFCTSSDGTRIAYATVGSGPSLVKTSNWMSHLEYDWESPVWRHLYEQLSRDHFLVRYDQRGNGLSDRDVEEISFDAFVRDLETVVDAAGLDRFALLGVSQGCAASVAYAVRHPERVSHLVLYGGYTKGINWRSPEDREKWEALDALLRHGWGQDNPAFRQMFTAMFMPGANLEQMQWFNELQRVSTSPEIALRIRHVNSDIDVTELMPRVSVPTLVMHARDDVVVPFTEGRELAMGIPGARFVALEGQNHLLLEDEPAWPRFLSELRGFIDTGG